MVKRGGLLLLANVYPVLLVHYKSSEANNGGDSTGGMAAVEEVILRQFELSDLEDFWIWASDTRVAATCSWEAYTSMDELQRFMEETVLPNPWFRAITLGGRPVGALTLKVPEDASERCRGELGYVVAYDWWRKGVATAAVRAATAAVLAEVEGLERVEALVELGNAASQRVLEKVGYKREGVLRNYRFNKGRMRDMVMYSFISTDAFLF